MAVSRRGFIGGMAALLGAVLAAPVLESAPLSGSETLPVEPSTVAETFEVGDVFTIKGRYAINPVTQRPLWRDGGSPMLQQFVVTARTTADELAAAPAPAMCPRLIGAGPYRNTTDAGPFRASDVRRLEWVIQEAQYRERVPQRFEVSKGAAYQPQTIGDRWHSAPVQVCR